jgi:uncharacterized OB-fold protein
LLRMQDYSDETHPEAAYQELLDRGIFALYTCTLCDRAHYSPRVLCPFCGSDSLAWRQSEGHGVVYSMSTIEPRGRDPYVVALIDLDDGPRLMSNVIGISADQVGIGMRVKARIEVRNGSAVPLFEEERSQ